ncbi:BAR domain-containing protein [Aliarcobacter butzleri]|uniref:hypothetical protein n=1 Tax=Aliarcobacter butzleri TaxID=28197 RepID=UPI0021B6A5CF|nr:hypothetical protein [Aliarcobacter butzleri]MCT7579205.1 hypothetical protein [Aliarcobacter butzleri]MCT7587120.1 hypothetical protein [Aliarcobacter butzleri]
MSQIRNTKIQDIKHIINQSNLFSINDFKFDFPDKDEILAKIVFRASNKYSFSIIEDYKLKEEPKTLLSNLSLMQTTYSKEKVLQVKMSPGNDKNFEIHTINNIDEGIRKISSWLYNLDEDLKCKELFDEIENSTNIDEFENILNEKFTNENERFSDEEKEYLIKKITELQERIEKLEDKSESIQSFEKKKKESIQSFEESKREINTYPKKAWWLKTFNRFKNIDEWLTLANKLTTNIKDLLENFQN